MYGIEGFFKKIRDSFSGEVLFRTLVKKTVEKYCGVEVPIGNISSQGGVVNLRNLSQSAKSAIFVKKVLILKEIRSFAGKRNVMDIRF